MIKYENTKWLESLRSYRDILDEQEERKIIFDVLNNSQPFPVVLLDLKPGEESINRKEYKRFLMA